MLTLIFILCFPAAGLLLLSMGYGLTTWQHWGIIALIAISGAVSFKRAYMEGYKRGYNV